MRVELPLSASEKLKQEQGSFALSEWYRWRYLKSEHWLNLRAEKLDENPKCERCWREPATQVHHLRYKSIYDVTLDDLQSVCRRCHAGHHNKPYNSPQLLIPLETDQFSTPEQASISVRQFKRQKLRRFHKRPMTKTQLAEYSHLMNRGRL